MNINEKEIETKKLPSLDMFLSEIAKHVSAKGAMITLSGTFLNKSYSQTWAIDWINGKLQYGLDSVQSLLFPARFYNILSEGNVGIILRTFTSQRDRVSGFPIKEIRGYLVRMESTEIIWRQLSVKEIEEAHCTDARTGKPIPREPDIVFFGLGEYHDLDIGKMK